MKRQLPADSGRFDLPIQLMLAGSGPGASNPIKRIEKPILELI